MNTITDLYEQVVGDALQGLEGDKWRDTGCLHVTESCIFPLHILYIAPVPNWVKHSAFLSQRNFTDCKTSTHWFVLTKQSSCMAQPHLKPLWPPGSALDEGWISCQSTYYQRLEPTSTHHHADTCTPVFFIQPEQAGRTYLCQHNTKVCQVIRHCSFSGTRRPKVPSMRTMCVLSPADNMIL